jgi:hypothetical protein
MYLGQCSLPADDCGCGHRWPACAHAQSMVTPGHTHAGAQIHESFLREILFFTDSRKFSPSKIFRYIYGMPAILFRREVSFGLGRTRMSLNTSFCSTELGLLDALT